MPALKDQLTPYRFIILDPGHFHAALVQKRMYSDVDPLVHIYAPGGEDLNEHLQRVEWLGTRAEHPTRWRQKVHAGPDFLQRMLNEKAGDIVIIAGNNAHKANYIAAAVRGGFNVLADKPILIRPSELPVIVGAFEEAERRGLLLFDIMTERFEITTILQRELSRDTDLFGELRKGSPDEPAIIKESVHHFAKTVAGSPLRRPVWFFDVRQQGEGIVDVMTHLVDLIQWESFPNEPLQPSDAQVLSARRWATELSREQFHQVTGWPITGDWPAFLTEDVRDSMLHVYSNGEFTYTLRGIHAKVSVIWNFEAPGGGGDTHYSILRGTRARLIIRQGPKQSYKPVVYVEKEAGTDNSKLEAALRGAIANVQKQYPGVGFQPDLHGWRVTVPARYDVGHEAHFGQVTDQFLQYLRERRLPEWEVPNMITKYSTIMQAYEMCR